MTPEELNKLFKAKEDYIDSKLAGLEKDVQALQRQLLELIMGDYVGKFDTEDGVIVANEKNIRLATEMEGVMNKYNSLFQKNVLKGFGQDMLKITGFTTSYFKGMDYSAKKLASIKKGMGFISQRIGITQKGNIIKGSYLDSLSQNPEVRRELKDFVLNQVAGQNNYGAFLKGLKERIVGNKETEGILQRYYRQYAYDSFNQVDATINKHFADDLGMEYFVYFGSLVRDSREFCKKRAGKVFSVEETKDWKNDPTLPGKSKEGYNPLIDRGRWNCRHQIQFVPKEYACDKRPELCGDKEIIIEKDIYKPIEFTEKDYNKRVLMSEKEGKEWDEILISSKKREEILKNYKALVNEKDINTIKLQTSDEYEKINNALRGKTLLIDKIKDHIRDLNEALNKLPKYTGESLRGANFKSEKDFFDFVNKMKPGLCFSDPAPLSSTISNVAASKFISTGQYKVFIKIQSKTGRFISPISEIWSELEVMYKPNTKFIIRGNSIIESEWQGKKYYEFYLKLEEL